MNIQAKSLIPLYPAICQVWQGQNTAKLNYTFRIIAIENGIIYCTNMEKPSIKPIRIDYQKFIKLIESKKLRQVPDPYADRIIAPEMETQDSKASSLSNKRIELFSNYLISTKAITDSAYRSLAIKAIQKNLDVKSRNTIVTLIVRFWQSGFNAVSLYPKYDKRGRKQTDPPAKNQLPKEEADLMDDFFWEHIAIRETPTITEAYCRFRALYHIKSPSEAAEPNATILDESCPTYDQFYYRFRSWLDDNYIDVLVKTNGKIEYNLKYRDILGRNDYPPLSSGSCFFVDSTRCDYAIVDEARKNLLGRPYLTFVSDLYSRAICGYYLSLEAESAKTLRMVLFNTFSDKRKYCKKYGFSLTETAWPMHFLPGELTTDNGSPYKSLLSDSICESLFIPIRTLEPHRGDHKAQLEHMFYTIDNHFGTLPGKVTSDKDIDYRKSTTLTLNELHKIIIDFILRFNRSAAIPKKEIPEMFGLDIEPNPNSLWNFGILNHGGALRYMDQAGLYYRLLPKESAAITKNGLRFKKMHYSNDKVRSELAWFVKARSQGQNYIDIHYNPDYVDEIYYINYKTGETYTFTMLKNERLVYGSLSFDECEFEIKRRQKLLKAQQEKADLDKVLGTSYRDKIIEKSKKKTKLSIQKNGKINLENQKELSKKVQNIEYQKHLKSLKEEGIIS